MTKLYIFAGILIAVAAFFQVLKSSTRQSKLLYKYKRKDFLLTRAEHEFYKVLQITIGEIYEIFPQVHLPSLLEHKIPGQNWKAAFSHISQKSVDFVLCEKEYLKPVLAIEVDDKSHEREDRIARDGEVEQMLADAGIPLLRIQNHGSFDIEKIKQEITFAIKV